MIKLGLSFTICLLALPFLALAQDLAISGTVTDQTGGVLPGVTVEAAGPGLAGGSRVAATDGEGGYVLDGMPAGEYSVSFSLSGFESDAIFTVEDAFNRTANAFTGTAQFGAYSIRGVNNNGLDSGFGNANALASILLNQTAVGPRTGDYLNPSLFDVGSVEITRVASRSLLNGRVGYELAGWSLYLWGTNLLDDQYELGLFDGRLFGLGGAYGRMADPRAAGAGVDFDW